MSSPNISHKGTYALIPARGGSKGLPGKNIKNFCGKPLIAWTIEAAFACPCIERVIVSSDDEEIMSVSREYGAEVPFKREPRLSGDAASTVDVVIDALNLCPEAKTVVLLQPTSPLRMSVDIKNALNAYFDAGAKSCVSVSEAVQSPYLMFSISDQQTLVSLLKRSESLRRQELPTAYILNGAIYIADVEWLKRTQTFLDLNTLPYVMPSSRSVDIDTLEDFKYAEYLINENNKLDGVEL
jgi:CMP-N-acetylneuraminic acid synthetase